MYNSELTSTECQDEITSAMTQTFIGRPFAAAGALVAAQPVLLQQSTLYLALLFIIRPVHTSSYKPSSAVYGDSSARSILFSYIARKTIRRRVDRVA